MTSLTHLLTGLDTDKVALVDAENLHAQQVTPLIEKLITEYVQYVRMVGINNPTHSPADVYARPDVTALWASTVARTHQELSKVMEAGFSAGAQIGRSQGAVGPDRAYLDAVLHDLQNYLYGTHQKIVDITWEAYRDIPMLPSYPQGGSAQNVPHDTAQTRWDRVQQKSSSVVTDIAKRAKAGTTVVVHRGYTEAQLAQVASQPGLVGAYRKMWVANFSQDPQRGPCLTCIALHGTVVNAGESFPSDATFAAKAPKVYKDLLGPPRHIHCRCTLLVLPSDTPHEKVAGQMQDYAVQQATAQMVTKGFTSGQVRSMPGPLYTRLWRLISPVGWLHTMWKVLRWNR